MSGDLPVYSGDETRLNPISETPRNETPVRCLVCGRRRPQIGVCCIRCRDRMEERLNDVQELYALLPAILLPGAGSEEKSFSKVKRDAAPLPGHGGVMNLRGPTNPGDGGPDPYNDNHGPLPTREALHTWERRVRQERGLPAPDPLAQLAPWLSKQLQWAHQHHTTPFVRDYLGWLIAGIRTLPELYEPSVTSVAKFLRRHLDWICAQDWADDFAEEIKRAHTALLNICGEHRPVPIGTCPALTERDGQQVECGESLYVPLYSTTIQCNRCHAEWPEERWMLLGAGLLDAG